MMKDFLEKFTEYCKNPNVEDSNKAKSYSKAIEYLCDYLKITKIDSQSVEKIKSIEGYISDKNSTFYKELLSFLIKRKQKSYLDNGFIRAALKPFFEFTEKYKPNVKEIFRKWFAEKPQKNNKDVNYSANTIDAAVRLLETGMSKLGLTKYANLNCFDVTSYSEFKVIREECYSLAEKFDKSQFHGDFRNGLDFYLMFLEELAQFKELLEIFVHQLKINNDIIPGEKIYGQGYKDMPKIQNIYKHCREFDGYILEINLQAGFHSYDSSNYINLRETWINIVPLFQKTPEGNHDVNALQVVIKPDNKVANDYPEETIDALGLFDKQSPNINIIKLFGDFKYEIDKYLKSKTGIFDSWEIINETTAIKTCDKSFFEYKGSGVPKEICWFFDAENIPKGSSKPINLLFGGNSGKNYKGVLKNDSTDRRRIQIRWNSDLGELFEQFKDLNAKAKFVKTDVDTYEIYMCVEKDDAEKDAWLLAWNPNSWEWEDLKEACELTRNGNVYNITWSCASNSVKVGDRVYIIVLGTTENGIIASGHAISEQYEYEHWDEQKRADGKKNKGIDIELEYIIDPESDAPLAQLFLKKNFPEQHWSPQASGISIKEQYVNDLYDEWLKHVSKIQGGEKEMTTKEKINAIKSYIAARGFNYEGDLIENFYLSLKSKPFVILAGTSGTGKTRLVKLFAEAIGAEMQLVPVRPDWSDSSDLFGHLDLNGDFKKGAIIDFVKDASDHLTKPYFLCFDEMNLARVEHYMSDILSVIETRDFDENKKRIITSPLIEKDFCRCSNGRNEYGELRIPENLYIIGTVNMDETTFPFSKKVLDRANTIEFSFVDLMSKPVRFESIPQKLNEDNSFLKTEYLYLLDCDDSQVIDTVCFNLEELNQILVKANLHVGYRVRDEILFYMMNNKKASLLSEEAAFDHEIMQKILPRVQGSSAAIKDVLSELFVKCAGDFSGFSGVSTFEQMNTYIDQKDCKYPNSAKKIAFMMRRYEEDGFTSYWL